MIPTSSEENIVGGLRGHILRRCIHIMMAVCPFLYYNYGLPIAEKLHLTPIWLVGIVLIFVFAFELLRLENGWTFFGQRLHEAKHISSFAWAVMGLCFVLLFSSGPEYAFPIIWGCALGDPFIGELRKYGVNRYAVFILGVLFISAIWLASGFWLGTPLWLAALMGPVVVIAEWPNLYWLDDNALMMFTPLLIITLLIEFGLL